MTLEVYYPKGLAQIISILILAVGFASGEGIGTKEELLSEKYVLVDKSENVMCR